MVIGPVAFGSVLNTRRTYVPAEGGFARFLDSFTNPGTADQTVTVTIATYLNYGTSTRIPVEPTAMSPLVVADSVEPGPLAPLAHVFGGPGGVALPEIHAVTGDPSLTARWTITIPAGATVSLLHFTLQAPTADAANAQAQSLVGFTNALALFGLTGEERARVINFQVPQP